MAGLQIGEIGRAFYLTGPHLPFVGAGLLAMQALRCVRQTLERPSRASPLPQFS